MQFDLETVKNLATLAAPFTSAIVETYLKPKLQEHFKKSKADREVFEHSLTGKFEEYLSRSFERHSYLTTIVFPNQRKLLKNLYIPLTVRLPHEQLSIKIDSYHENFIPEFKRVLIKDTAGMGKSTLLRHLFLCAIEENAGIPIFIELRHLSSDRNILDVIHDELNPIDDEFDRNFILKLIRRGDFIFFLDGFDEVPLADREEVTRELRSFVSKARANEFIISSREEGALTAFSDFQLFNITPLSQEEAFELLDKYDQGRGLSDRIKAKILEDKSEGIEEFLDNPLLVSLLYKSFEFKPTIPLRKHIFYRQVYDALFESHDLTKGDSFVHQKRTNLDIDSFHHVLRALGFITVTKGKVEYEKDELLSYIAEARSLCSSVSFKEADFLYDLVSAVPLFVREGDAYRWAHKSIQEYFAAKFICTDAKGKQEAILRKIYLSPDFLRYANVMDLCYDIDYQTFRNSVIYDLISNYLEYTDNSHKLINRELVAESIISERKALCFAGSVVIYPPEFIDKIGRGEDKFERMKDYAENAGLWQENRSYSGSLWASKGGIIFFRNNHYTLLELLNDKNSPLVIMVESRIPLSPKDVCSTQQEPMLVDDNPSSPLNAPLVFPSVNELIKGVSKIVLHHHKCIEMKAEIEQDLQRITDVDFLTSSI